MEIIGRKRVENARDPADDSRECKDSNAGVVKNASIPESILNKKHNAINYHAVREACAADIMR
eukprot:CAMPEP_0178701930 /NCGR_PEP_ID=MMETSP0699-20121125/12574_1 /TAXON_ID=265572 /ORGANISM="Extubocellulus spinifer, Strain CCMP396" /LENGTH=62 /DNA_ID=CAMNT_0020348573 /DNA_START=1 /DNA_END=186 /DNA_ORIENTATION=-